MDLNLNTSLKQEQTLSPQMLQSLALLPMTAMELKDYIQKEIESNPALEIPEDSYNEESFEEDNYDDEAGDRKSRAIENSSVKGETLSEHLMAQLGVSNISDEQYKIGEMLIGNLDANGFFIVPLKILFEDEKFSESEIKKTVEVVQSFDPFGICVPDFRQSLIVQAKCSGMRESDLKVFESLVNNHLEQIKAGKTREVAATLHVSVEDLITFLAIMKSFTPFPGRNYDADNESYVVPEFSVHKEDDQLVVKMNKMNIPDMRVSADFVNLINNLKGPDEKETAAYIKASIIQANSLITQIGMRYDTLNKCAAALIEEQSEYFLDGPMYLKPMTLKDIASKIGVHETTMSRLVQSKWIETDWGLIPLKSLFTQGVSSATGDGEAVSRTVVKEHIATILKDNPKLSDQKIADKLLEMGIKCARRTVSKYRAELNIDSSYSRI